MKDNNKNSSRRDFIKLAGAGLLAAGLPVSTSEAASQSAQPKNTSASPETRKENSEYPDLDGYNVLLIVTDQERYFEKFPQSAELSTREKIQSEGVNFRNHYNCSNMCTASRSVMYTGQHIQQTGMFDNTNVAWQHAMSKDIPTIGDMMREAGYYTAYKGKVHWDQALEPSENKEHKLMTDAMEPYGFSDFNPNGDEFGHILGGYTHDAGFAGDSVDWLRSKGAVLNEKGKPFFLAVNLVNPHDIMYFDTDGPNQTEQDNGTLGEKVNKPPHNAIYDARHPDFPLPENLYQPIQEKGRPNAHYEYQKGWDLLLGHIPDKDANWRRYKDYYLNCLKDVDMQIGMVLDEVDRLGLRDNTVIVFTADHGEMCGNHNLRGKGPFSYEENIHVPLVVLHPSVRGGQSTQAVTSHLDLAPTLLSLTGRKSAAIERIKKSLPGKDLSSLLDAPEKAELNQIRTGALHCFDMLMTVDADFLKELIESKKKGSGASPGLPPKPDLKKRGNIRIVFDGRYKFSRYFAPLQHNTPQTFEEIMQYNDLELFDLKNDPKEMVNLAMDPRANKQLIMDMNAKMNTLIKEEVGKDVGQELPNYPNTNWAVPDFKH